MAVNQIPGYQIGGVEESDIPAVFARKDLLTTKGDMYVAGAGGILTRFPVGANGTVLTADSTQAAGVRYALPSAVITAGRAVLTDVVAPATVAVDGALGSYFSLLMTSAVGANRIIGNPTNLLDGHRLYFEIIQDSVGARTVTWGNAYIWTTDVPLVTLVAGAGKSTFAGFLYNAQTGKLKAQGVNHDA